MKTSCCIYREEHGGTHVEIWDDGETRSLWFDDVILQSEIDLARPDRLPNPVNRAMLAHLVFGRPQRRVLLCGCGGGAIARWFHARSPETRGVAVELSPTVARLAREYFDFPPLDSNWILEIADIREHIADDDGSYDFILADLDQNQQTPGWLLDGDFLGCSRARLAEGGCLLLNLILERDGEPADALHRIRESFGAETLLIRLPDYDNLLVLVFKGDAPTLPSADALGRESARWGIDFADLAGRMTWIRPYGR